LCKGRWKVLQVKDAVGGSPELGLQAQKVVRSARWFWWNRVEVAGPSRKPGGGTLTA